VYVYVYLCLCVSVCVRGARTCVGNGDVGKLVHISVLVFFAFFFEGKLGAHGRFLFFCDVGKLRIAFKLRIAVFFQKVG
jgi:hypothetical protein